MDFFYFLVTSSQSWETRFHENFFNSQDGFLLGVVGALILGILCALFFYFACCNSNQSVKYANIGVWGAMLIICGIVAYLYADNVIIGNSDTTDDNSLFRSYSFYKANDEYYISETSKPGVNPTYINDLLKTKNDIKNELDKGGDVRVDYDVTTAVLAILFFLITSIVVKRFTINGKTIPFEKP